MTKFVDIEKKFIYLMVLKEHMINNFGSFIQLSIHFTFP